ncbi:MAG TPA: hypothetical protein VFY10_09500 [Dehalococcoidia bacterium]|nr:hypothetical protein [Dehalococcoidia bacterium]
MRYTTLLAIPIVLLLVACGGKSKNKTPTPVATPPTLVAPTSTAPVQTPSASPTSASASPTATPSVVGTPNPDGTVDPEGFGGTDPVHLKANPEATQPLEILLKDVRVGAHPEQGGWDRIVFEFASTDPAFVNALPETDIEYVDGASNCGSGLPVALQGNVVLQVKFTGAQAHDDHGNVSIQGQAGNTPPKVAGPGNSIKEAIQNCDFEGDVTWSVGVLTCAPNASCTTPPKPRFKVTTLTSPARVIIDIKWP